MAAIPPAPSTLQSWEEAFNHPLPVVRKMESQLRTQISDNQTKLRSLVGTSYRDLLGTAERIIEMDSQMQRVEGNLAGIGRKCDYRVVERSRENSANLTKSGRQEQDKKLEVMARVKVLKGALEAVSRIVRKGGDALGAAKVLVLARLLHRSVSESENVPPVLAELKKKLAGVRRKLLAYIERSLARATGDRTVLSNTMCAYAMITSSTPKDVLRHFLQVRYEQLESQAETLDEDSILAMLDLYGKTLVDTRDLFPRRLAEALAQLSKASLSRDNQVTSVEELDLDIYSRWIPDDIRTFTPWVRHDQLTASESNEGLKSWAKQAQASFVQALGACLQKQEDARVVLSTRRNVLSKFLSVSSKLRNDDFTQSIKDLQSVFIVRLEQLAAKSANLSSFALKSLDNSSVPSQSLQSSPWTLATQSMNLNAGALAFRAAILDHRHGRDSAVKLEHDELDRWTAQLNSHWEFVTSMRTAKWDDDLDFDIDDLDYEGEETLQEALSRNDAAKFEQKLRESTTEAFKKAYESIEKASSTQSEQAAFFVRVLRELDLRRSALNDRLSTKKDSDAFDQTALISTLHNTLSEQASYVALNDFYEALNKQSTVAIGLWDGTPALPTQPSPATFRFLTALQTRMAEMGEDLWSGRAVEAVRNHVGMSLAGVLNNFPRKQEAVSTEKHEASDAAEPVEKTAGQDNELRVQRLFDTLYLAAALDLKSRDVLKSILSTLQKAAEVDATAEQRIEKSAVEYWKRTNLLFGLLAI
ncbi:hypothetical protein MBLNU13_g10955t1 [Cladosporium sp. NU13]